MAGHVRTTSRYSVVKEPVLSSLDVFNFTLSHSMTVVKEIIFMYVKNRRGKIDLKRRGKELAENVRGLIIPQNCASARLMDYFVHFMNEVWEGVSWEGVSWKG